MNDPVNELILSQLPPEELPNTENDKKILLAVCRYNLFKKANILDTDTDTVKIQKLFDFQRAYKDTVIKTWPLPDQLKEMSDATLKTNIVIINREIKKLESYTSNATQEKIDKLKALKQNYVGEWDIRKYLRSSNEELQKLSEIRENSPRKGRTKTKDYVIPFCPFPTLTIPVIHLTIDGKIEDINKKMHTKIEEHEAYVRTGSSFWSGVTGFTHSYLGQSPFETLCDIGDVALIVVGTLVPGGRVVSSASAQRMVARKALTRVTKTFITSMVATNGMRYLTNDSLRKNLKQPLIDAMEGLTYLSAADKEALAERGISMMEGFMLRGITSGFNPRKPLKAVDTKRGGATSQGISHTSTTTASVGRGGKPRTPENTNTTPTSQPQGPTTFKKEGGGGGGGPQATYQKTSGKSAFGAEHVEKPSLRENVSEKLKKGVTKDGGGGSSANTLQGASYEPSIKNLTPNVNAQSALNTKMRAIQKAKSLASRIKTLPDGRVRYYTAERLSKTPGPTRGSAHVTEYNPKTGQVRAWSECYDHSGKVNRINPKMIDGQTITGRHYPYTKKELEVLKLKK